MIHTWKMLADLHWHHLFVVALHRAVIKTAFVDVDISRADAIKWKTVAQSWAGELHPNGIEYTKRELAQLDRDPALAEVKARLTKETNVRLRWNLGQLLRTVDDMAKRKPNQVTASMLTRLAVETQRIRFETDIGVDELEVDGAMVTDKQLEGTMAAALKLVFDTAKPDGKRFFITSRVMNKIRDAITDQP